jgi:hypothetical protein
MKSSHYQTRQLVSISFFLCIPFCSLSLSSPNNDSTNLLQNSSFEFNNQPTLQYWIADTTLRKFAHDVPLDGGQWSLQLSPGWYPQEGFARSYVSAQLGVGVYQLTVWIKSINGWRGSVRLGQWSQNDWVNSRQIFCDSSAWTQYSLIDTISLQPNDSIAVQLSAGSAELANGDVLFDLVRLERIRSITNIEAKDKALPIQFVLHQNYPNPFNPATTISFDIPIQSFVSLKIYNVLGDEVSILLSEELAVGKYTKRWNAENFPNGVYFYRLQAGLSTETKRLVLLR